MDNIIVIILAYIIVGIIMFFVEFKGSLEGMKEFDSYRQLNMLVDQRTTIIIMVTIMFLVVVISWFPIVATRILKRVINK